MVSPDRYENNDSVALATSLGSISGAHLEEHLSVESDDADWYRFTLPVAGRVGDAVQVSFEHRLGDVDLELYNATGSVMLRQSAGVSNQESISLVGQSAGDYLLRVFGYNHASNPDYSLSLNVAPSAVTNNTGSSGSSGVSGGDRFENNDTAASAASLGTITGDVLTSSLSIESRDPDWYRFTLASDAQQGDQVTVNFLHSQGDVDIELYRADGTSLVGRSTGVGNQESISLGGLTAGDYLLKVYGFNGASNPNYDINIHVAPVTISAGDRFEDNDSAQSATLLPSINTTLLESGLSVQRDDADWYRFTLSSAGRDGDWVKLNFQGALGDVDMDVFAADGVTRVGYSHGVGDEELVSLAGYSAGDYLVKVYGYSHASNPDYSLSVHVAPTSVPSGDRFEDNDSAATASNLRIITGTWQESNLSIQADDADWYRFTLAATARSGDEVRVAFAHAQGDVDVDLYAADGVTRLGYSHGVGNAENISLAGYVAGDYLLKVYGYNHAANPEYSLSISAAEQSSTLAADTYEPNNDAAHATVLRQSSSLAALNIHSSTDHDWFTFTTSRTGTSADSVAIDFLQAQGNLDISLYALVDNQMTVLRRSDGVGNGEQISLEGMYAGTYWLDVYGVNGATNPNYSLNLSLGTALGSSTSGDRYESNNTVATATNLRVLSSEFVAADLNITSGDQDWFTFSTERSGTVTVHLDFQHRIGDLDLQVFDSSGVTSLAMSNGVMDYEDLSFSATAGQSYYVKVYGYGGASNSQYSLTIDAPQPASLSPDQWESNNSAAQATQIRSASQHLSGATITAGDQDWYAFHLAATGTQADSVSFNYQGDRLQLSLCNAQAQTVSNQSTVSHDGFASVSLQGLAAGDYYVQVAGADSSSVASYDLNVVTTPAASAGTAQDTWTVLVYIAGDNNLEAAGLEDINEMESVLLPSNVNVVVQMDRASGYSSSDGNWTDTRRGAISHDNNSTVVSSNLQSIGETNSGAMSTLQEFINWGSSNFAAQHYALVVWDHGGGALYGTCQDGGSSNSSLSLDEVSQAILGSSLRRVDLLGFDACLMGMVDQAVEAKSYASVLVASEQSEPGDGWDYQATLTQLANNANSSASELAGEIVASYGRSYGNTQTLSAIDLSRMDSLETCINSFVDAMQSASSADWAAVKRAAGLAWKADSNTSSFPYVDLGNFMGQIVAQSPALAIRTAAQAVEDAVQASVLRKVGSSSADGLTVVLPVSGSLSYSLGYNANNFDYLQQTRWDDFLTLYAASGSAARSSSTLGETTDLSGRSILGSNDVQFQALDLGTVAIPDYQVTGLAIDGVGDVDWYHFQLAQSAPQTAALQLLFDSSQGDLTLQLFDAQQQQLSAESHSNVSLAGLNAGTDYFIKVSGVGSASALGYSLHLDATGGVRPNAAPSDFAEVNGGNNSVSKAWNLGSACDLVELGSVNNLTMDAQDAAQGADGGDWFRVQGVRQLELNANSVTINGVGVQQGDLALRVYDNGGHLLAQSAGAGLSESVSFAQQTEDVLIQVYSQSGQQNFGYSLAVSNALPAQDEGVTVGVRAYSWNSHALLSGVTVDGSHATGSDGLYQCVGVSSNRLELTPELSSSTSAASAVNLQDAISIMKMVVGLDVNSAGRALSPYQAIAADFDGDGAVNLADAINVLKHVVGLSAPTPNWVFTNESDSSIAARAGLQPGAINSALNLNVAQGDTVGLVGVLRGDVDGSWSAPSGSEVLSSSYFTELSNNHGLNLSQFGIYA